MKSSTNRQVIRATENVRQAFLSDQSLLAEHGLEHSRCGKVAADDKLIDPTCVPARHKARLGGRVQSVVQQPRGQDTRVCLLETGGVLCQTGSLLETCGRGRVGVVVEITSQDDAGRLLLGQSLQGVGDL